MDNIPYIPGHREIKVPVSPIQLSASYENELHRIMGSGFRLRSLKRFAYLIDFMLRNKLDYLTVNEIASFLHITTRDAFHYYRFLVFLEKFLEEVERQDKLEREKKQMAGT